MIVEIGHFALILALLIACAQTVLPAIGAQRGRADLLRIGDSAAQAQLLLLTISFAALTHAFMTTDLSVTLVNQHSSIDKPFEYKIAGVWGNHEGSMLLWALMLALFGALVALFGGSLPLSLRGRVLSVQGAVAAAFLAFIIFTSNPFLRWPEGMGDDYLRGLLASYRMLPGMELLLPQLEGMSRTELMDVFARYASAIPVPQDGLDLNPVLQDPGLVLHPPILYVGYVGLSIAYAFAVAALWEGRVDAAWARWVRPWTLFAWVALTLGIALGSYWAYYELGWGGWWFWDPVENVSFMPWLAATALLHSAIVVEKRGELKSWTILLAITAFSFSLFGAFIVRSGVLNSVHAFASDPDRGLFILMILLLFVGGALTLYARRAPELASNGLFATVSRESALLINNVLLAAMLGAVFVGTVAPLVFQAFGLLISVGPPFFNIMMALFGAPLLLLLPLGAATPWKRAVAETILKRFAPALAASTVLVVVCLIARAVAEDPDGVSVLDYALIAFGALLGGWALFGAVYEPLERAKLPEAVLGRTSWAEFRRRLGATPLSLLGKSLAHGGLGLFVLGATLSNALTTADIRTAQIGERITHSQGVFGAVEFVVEAIEPVRGSNYEGLQAVVAVFANGVRTATVTPERRLYRTRDEITKEVGLSTGLARDFYVVFGERRDDGGWALETKVKPFTVWIWLGCLIMAIGGLCSLMDRRLRVGAPSARKAATAAVMAFALLFAAAPGPAFAIEPEEQFEDPAQEARARALFKELRCMVCAGQSVDDSDAQIAKDIRGYVRRQISNGASDQQILDGLSQIWGPSILMRPPLFGPTFFIWALPIAALAVGGVLVARRMRAGAAESSAASEPPLSESEAARLDQILKDARDKASEEEKDAKADQAALMDVSAKR